MDLMGPQNVEIGIEGGIDCFSATNHLSLPAGANISGFGAKVDIDTGALIWFWCINLVLMQRSIFLILVHELVPIDTGGAQARLIVNQASVTSLPKVPEQILVSSPHPHLKPQALWVTQGPKRYLSPNNGLRA